MEPMTLGSPPSGSPSGSNVSGFLPSFLMGETNVPTTPRNNTLSPSKGRPLAFAQTPTNTNSPADFHNRSVLQQKSLYGYPQNSPAHNYGNTSQINNPNNQSISGPPTQSLFDSLRNVNLNNSTSQYPSVNESYAFNDFNASRMLSPIQSPSYDIRNNNNNNYLNNTANNHFNTSDFHQQQQHHSPLKPHSLFWITVYGFPQSSTSIILSHFSQCGTIIDKIFAPQNGNWIYLKYSSKLECDKALNYHERVISNGLMIGVTYCKDKDIVSKEVLERSQIPTNRVRPLNHTAYRNAQSSTEVAQNSPAPKLTTGLVNKAMDYIFGW